MELSADKLTYLNICKVSEEDGWGSTLNGVARPIFIFENTSTGLQIGFYRSANDDVVCLVCPDADAVDQYVHQTALNEFNALTGHNVNANYLNELFMGVLNKDPDDFEYENDVETLLFDGEESIQSEALAEVVNCFGAWALSKHSIQAVINSSKKSLIFDGNEIYGEFDKLFDDLFGHSEQTALIIKN